MFKKIFFIAILISFLAIPALTTFSQSTCPPNMSLKDCQQWALGQVSQGGGLGQAGPIASTAISQKIGQIIASVLAFLGVVFLIIVVFSGIQWMTAGGNEEKITKARTRLINAAVGLAIVIAAYAITWFVVNSLAESSNYSTGVMQNAPDCQPQCCAQDPTQLVGPSNPSLCQANESCKEVAGGEGCQRCACVPNFPN